MGDLRARSQGQIDVVGERVDGPDGPAVQIAVRDRGCGSLQRALPTRFDTFTQVGESSRWRRGSAGQGLAVSEELMDLFCGEGPTRVDGVLRPGVTFHPSLLATATI